MKREELPELVDSFGRRQQAEFPFKALVEFVRRESAGKLDEDDLYDLAATSDYLFESWNDPLKETFIPRRDFFQAAQFRITPARDEVEGGYLFPGDRFFPFVSREVFPADARLVLPDGSALHTRTLRIPLDSAMGHLRFYGQVNAMEYLIADKESNAAKLKPPCKGLLDVTVFDLRALFTSSGFRLGDSLMLTVIDWLHGVFSVVHAPAAQTVKSLAGSRKWMRAMLDAFEEARLELEDEGDCYEQLAYMMHLGESKPELPPLMKDPPISIGAFFDLCRDIDVKLVGDRALFRRAKGDEAGAAIPGGCLDPRELETELDVYLRELGLSITEGEVAAHMRDALFCGRRSPDSVLVRVAAGRSLYFRSAEEQEEFHDLWCVLWDDVRADYMPADDSFGQVRSEFLALNDKCVAALRRLEAKKSGDELVNNPLFLEFSKLTAVVSSTLTFFNLPTEDPESSPDVFGTMLENLRSAIDGMIDRLEKG